MNRLLIAFAGSLLALNAVAQDTIPLYSEAIARQKASLMAARRPYVGLDLARGMWLAFSTQASYYRPVALVGYWPTRTGALNKSAYVGVGYAAYGGTLQRNIYQQGGSAHIRAGVEFSRNGLQVGVGGLLAGWSGQGSFVFKGPTFGDYQQPIGQLAGGLIGGESHLGGDVALGRAVVLRLLARGTAYVRTTNQYGIASPYVSGLDVSMRTAVGVAGSFSAYLLFRL